MLIESMSVEDMGARALDLQDASNITAVLNTFTAMVDRMKVLGFKQDDFRKSPALCLMLDKLRSMQEIEFAQAYEAAEASR